MTALTSGHANRVGQLAYLASRRRKVGYALGRYLAIVSSGVLLSLRVAFTASYQAAQQAMLLADRHPELRLAQGQPRTPLRCHRACRTGRRLPFSLPHSSGTQAEWRNLP